MRVEAYMWVQKKGGFLLLHLYGLSSAAATIIEEGEKNKMTAATLLYEEPDIFKITKYIKEIY